MLSTSARPVLYPALLSEPPAAPESLYVMRILAPSEEEAAARALFPPSLELAGEASGGGGEDFRLRLCPPGEGERECLPINEDDRLRHFSSSMASFKDAKNDFI